jgi:hypothetical protein
MTKDESYRQTTRLGDAGQADDNTVRVTVRRIDEHEIIVFE